MTTSGRDRAVNLLIGGIGLLLILAFWVGTAYLATQIYCFRSGKCPSLLTIGKSTSVGGGSSVPEDYFNDAAPNLKDDFAKYGSPKNHPIPLDLAERMRGKFPQAPDIFNIIEYRGYVFINLVTGDENYYLAVYRWNGTAWIFVTLFCETCE